MSQRLTTRALSNGILSPTSAMVEQFENVAVTTSPMKPQTLNFVRRRRESSDANSPQDDEENLRLSRSNTAEKRSALQITQTRAPFSNIDLNTAHGEQKESNKKVRLTPRNTNKFVSNTEVPSSTASTLSSIRQGPMRHIAIKRSMSVDFTNASPPESVSPFDEDESEQFPSFCRAESSIATNSNTYPLQYRRMTSAQRSYSEGNKYVIMEEPEQQDESALKIDPFTGGHQIISEELHMGGLPDLQHSEDPVLEDSARRMKRPRSNNNLTQSSPFVLNNEPLAVPAESATLVRSMTDTTPVMFSTSASFSVTSSTSMQLQELNAAPADMKPNLLLPTTLGDDGTYRVTPSTVIDLMDGKFDQSIKKFIIIDCRYKYEYECGHIKGAVNIHDRGIIQKFFNANCALPYDIAVIFHCEYSQHRGPATYKFMRTLDRTHNADSYPNLSFANMYVIDGGYIKFHEQNIDRCIGTDEKLYVSMWDARYDAELKECHRESWCSRRQKKRKKAQRKRFFSQQNNTSPIRSVAPFSLSQN